MEEMGAVSGSRGTRSIERSRLLRRHHPDDRGVAIVEFALVAPLLFLVLFGIIEFGFVFKDSLTLTNMTRSGARTGAAVGNATSPDADYQILSAITSSAGALSANINGVIIFTATATSSALPTGCSFASGSTAGCNVYTPTQLSEVKQSNGNWTTMQTLYPTAFKCQSGWDDHWCPSTRVVSQSGNGGSGPDYLGVYISAHHSKVTGWFQSLTLTDTSVMRLEPQSL